jgi:hypothetical protein
MPPTKSNQIAEMKPGDVAFFNDSGRSIIVLASKIGKELSRKYMCCRVDGVVHVARVK